MQRHLFHLGGVGDDGLEKTLPESAIVLHQFAMQALSPIHDGKEGHHRGSCDLFAFQKLHKLLVRADGKRRRNQWDQDRVDGPENAFRNERDSRRTVDKNMIVFASEKPQKRSHQPFGPGRRSQPKIEMAIPEIGRQKIDRRDISPFDLIFDGTLAPDQLPRPALHPRLDSKGECARSLGVEIPDQDPRAGAGGAMGKVDGGGRLPDPTLDIVDS